MLTYNGASYIWMGRELRKITNGSNTYSYKYNADGIRTSKTVNGTTTEFFLNGSQILAQKTGDSVMRFFYDSTGKRVGFANGTMLFYYLYNVQGDVIAIVRAATGQVVAKYSYDAWGNCTVTNAAGYAVGDKNPFRYRGYYYDTETGLYYLNSRYYSPEFGRFISVDNAIGQIGSVHGANMFAYCFNNPINMSDPMGNWPSWSQVFTGVAIAALAVAAAALTVASCGAAVPALALAGGIIGGMSSGAATIAAGALFVAGASATASVASKTVEKKADRNSKRNNTVYKLVDKNDEVQYVGRTTNVTARADAHKHNPFRKDLRMEIIAQDLSYNEARGLEQIAMLQCHTINTANRMNNQINGISPFNKSLGIYMAAGRGVAEYLGNQISNEILYWTGN